MSDISALAAFELKLQMLFMAASLKQNFDHSGASLLNKAARELYCLTGEVFCCGRFVTVARGI